MYKKQLLRVLKRKIVGNLTIKTYNQANAGL